MRRSDDNPDFEDELMCFDILDPYQYVMDGDVQLVIEVWNKVDMYKYMCIYICIYIYICADRYLYRYAYICIYTYQYVMDGDVQLVIEVWNKVDEYILCIWIHMYMYTIKSIH
jgi:hypothetical protein